MNWEEFQTQLNDPDLQLYFRSIDLDLSEAKGLFSLLDLDENGTVESEEFIMGCLRLRGQAKAIDLASLTYEMRQRHRQMTALVQQFTSDVLGALSEKCLHLSQGA